MTSRKEIEEWFDHGVALGATHTIKEIEEWFDHGVAIGATHMLVVCDTYDYDDYPSYVMPGQDAKAMSSNLGSMQKLMEVYNLSMDKNNQLSEQRAFNY